MINDIMEMLKKDLMIFRDSLRETGEFDLDTDMFEVLDALNANGYEIILTEGRWFSLDIGTCTFPEFDFNDIVYINKKFSDSEKSIDTEIGEYKTRATYEYKCGINEKFHRDINKELETDNVD